MMVSHCILQCSGPLRQLECVADVCGKIGKRLSQAHVQFQSYVQHSNLALLPMALCRNSAHELPNIFLSTPPTLLSSGLHITYFTGCPESLPASNTAKHESQLRLEFTSRCRSLIELYFSPKLLSRCC